MSSEVKRCWNFCFSSWESLEATSTIASITVFRMSLDALQSRTVDATRDRNGKGMLRKGKAKEGGKRMQKSSTRAQDSTRGKLPAGSLRALLPYWMSWMHWRRMSSLAVMGSARSCSIH